MTEQSFIRLHGYAILANIFPRNEISEVADVTSQSQLKRSRAGARHLLSVPGVCKVAEDLRLLSIAREVLGQAAIPFGATLFDKSPSSNWLWPGIKTLRCHWSRGIEEPGWGPWSIKEDVNYAHAPREALEPVLALRVHLDDSESANGPLRVIPERIVRAFFPILKSKSARRHRNMWSALSPEAA